jgi:hypothetical protein
MNDLIIPHNIKTTYQPKVHFSSKTGECLIEGESYMENPKLFYEPLTKWLNDYLETNPTSLHLIFKIYYFNTSSSRQLMNIIELLRSFQNKSVDIKIDWYYDPDDLDMKEEVEDFIMETGMDINMKIR